MKVSRTDLEQERILTEKTLTDKAYDFTAKFLAVNYLQSLTESHPDVINTDTIAVLEQLLIDYEFRHQTQAYFMYKEVANTLCSIIVHSETLAGHAFNSLKSLLGMTNGHPHRATAEALGSLPFSIHGPEVKETAREDVPCVTWQELIAETGLAITYSPVFIGRSMVAAVQPKGKLFVVKLVRSDESLDSLTREALWMGYLSDKSHCFPIRFNIPKAISVRGSHAFRLSAIPVSVPDGLGLHKENHAICFVADDDYFSYPNDVREEKRLANAEFGEVILRNAWILGKLTSLGIVHAAPIPLFHNRVQRNRRRDGGLYEWPRAGRLDRWLDSCLYPNVGLTGVRDFEHLESFSGKSKNLYRHIGSHMLSLLLIAGSYFRNKDRTRVGFDKDGSPVDARDLFDREFLKDLIKEIFKNYYHGFAGDEFEGDLPTDLETFSSRMIDEMGVDRHMEEILRAADQNEMTDEEFKTFLEKRGFSSEKIASLQKGEQDIVIYSGPHLGEFNNRISLPEMIELVGTMSSLCIAGRYCMKAPDLQ
jgi:hypothetical protein